jgi:hypothetical protein
VITHDDAEVTDWWTVMLHDGAQVDCDVHEDIAELHVLSYGRMDIIDDRKRRQRIYRWQGKIHEHLARFPG